MKYLYLLFILAISFALETRLYNANNEAEAIVGQIERLTILQNELFFISEDHKRFGYINKTNGRVTRVSTLNKNERILDHSRRTVFTLINQKNVLLNYNISTKGSAKNMRFKNKDFGEIVQYLMVPHGIFILTNNDLRYYNEGMGKDLNQCKITREKQERLKEKNEKYLNIFYMSNQDDYKIVLASILENQNRQICFREYIKFDMKKEHCYPVEERGQPRIQRSGSTLFVSFEGMTYVIDNNLILQSKFTEKPLQFHQGFAIMDGETTYLTHKNAIYSERIIESSEMEQIKMKISKESITILEDNKEIGKIQNNENTNPYRAWIKKQEDGKTYELVIQSSKMDLNLFTLTSSKKKQDRAVFMWNRPTKNY